MTLMLTRPKTSNIRTYSTLAHLLFTSGIFIHLQNYLLPPLSQLHEIVSVTPSMYMYERWSRILSRILKELKKK